MPLEDESKPVLKTFTNVLTDHLCHGISKTNVNFVPVHLSRRSCNIRSDLACKREHLAQFSTRMKPTIAILCAAVAVVTAQQFCPMDVHQCESGEFVGRDSNNNCEFHPCPDTDGSGSGSIDTDGSGNMDTDGSGNMDTDGSGNIDTDGSGSMDKTPSTPAPSNGAQGRVMMAWTVFAVGFCFLS